MNDLKLVAESATMDTPTNIADEDVWLGRNSHLGTKVFRRAIRLAAEDFEEEEFSKGVYSSIKKEIKGCRFFWGEPGQLREIELRNDVKRLIASAFEEEKEKRWAKQSGRSKRQNWGHKLNDGTSCTDKEDCESGRSRSYSEKKQQRKAKGNTQGCEAAAESIKEAQDTDKDMNIYIGDERKPGTKKLLDAVRMIADNHPETKYSDKIFALIVAGFQGRKFFWSLKSLQEIPESELWVIVKQLWKMDVYMVKAHAADVYFSVSSHPGTQAWVRSTQQVVIEHGESKYNRRIYNEIKRRLHHSNFYIGRPPECDEATTRERAEMFKVRYEMEKEVWARFLRKRKVSALAKMKAKVTSGCLKPQHILDPCEDAATEDSTPQSNCCGKRGYTVPVCAQAIPGALYWMQLSHRIRRSQTYAQIRDRLKTCPNTVAMRCSGCSCNIRFRRHFRTCPLKWRSFFRIDYSSGQGFNRIHECLKMKVVRQATAVPALVLLILLLAVVINVIFRSILKGILVPLL